MSTFCIPLAYSAIIHIGDAGNLPSSVVVLMATKNTAVPSNNACNSLFPPSMHVMNISNAPQKDWSIDPRPEYLPDNGRPPVSSSVRKPAMLPDNLPFPTSSTASPSCDNTRDAKIWMELPGNKKDNQGDNKLIRSEQFFASQGPDSPGPS